MPFIPILPSIFGDLTTILVPSYGVANPNSLCSKLRMRYLDCLEAYGCAKGRDKCAELFYDVLECHAGTFQKLRSAEIRRERMKQYREGKLKVPFDEHPPLDSFLYL